MSDAAATEAAGASGGGGNGASGGVAGGGGGGAGGGDTIGERLEAKRPHDGMTLEELAGAYNFRQTSDRRRIMVNIMLDHLKSRPAPRAALDIGCGAGMGRSADYLAPLRESVSEFWGVEPDPDVAVSEHFDTVRRSLLEDADLPEDHFDVAYAIMVMEHVADPVRFMTAVHRCLKPGGAFFFVTPNRRHYFTLFANAAKKLRIDELALRLVRGKGDVDDYHYPVVYRFNAPEDVDRTIKPIGFSEATYAYLEEDGPRPYFRGPLFPIFWLMCKKREIRSNADCLLDFVGRVTK